MPEISFLEKVMESRALSKHVADEWSCIFFRMNDGATAVNLSSSYFFGELISPYQEGASSVLATDKRGILCTAQNRQKALDQTSAGQWVIIELNDSSSGTLEDYLNSHRLSLRFKTISVYTHNPEGDIYRIYEIQREQEEKEKRDAIPDAATQEAFEQFCLEYDRAHSDTMRLLKATTPADFLPYQPNSLNTLGQFAIKSADSEAATSSTSTSTASPSKRNGNSG